MSGELPEGWRWAKLGEVCEIVNGSTPKSGVGEYWGGSVTWITPTDLGQLSVSRIDRSGRTITDAGYASCSTKLVPAGSVVISSRAPIGHLGIAGVPLCTNQGCKSLVPGSGLDSGFLYHTLMRDMNRIRELGSGATFPEVSKRVLAGFEILLPPLDEQRRIVGRLEAQIAAADRAREAAAAQLAAIEAIPAALLREIFPRSPAAR